MELDSDCNLLVLNTGSATLKAAVFNCKQPDPIWQKNINWKNDYLSALKEMLHPLAQLSFAAIGHRVVHGGEVFNKATLIDASVKQCIKDLSFLAPLHNPVNLAGIEVCESLFPRVAQFAVFDTAFHTTLHPAVSTYPLPYKYRKHAVKRYGFHGISHAYCSKRCAALLDCPIEKLKIIVCHLGAGASLCAIKEGKSIDTTMGMTPLEGLMMATRCGSVDPGILLYLLKEQNCSVDTLDHELNFASGLLGISGISGDIREILQAAARGHQRSELALDMFVHRLSSCIGAMIASLQGLDAIVFTAGIGEHVGSIREKACAPFQFMGMTIDQDKNRSPSLQEREISSLQSNIKIFVIPTNEELEIAEQCRNLIVD